MRQFLVVIAVITVACSGPKRDPVAPDPMPPVGSGPGSAAPAPAAPPPPAAPDAACLDATTKLGTWLSSLVAEGESPVMSDRVTFAKLDDAAAAPIAAAPVVFIDPHEVTFQGRLLDTVPVKDAKEIQDALAGARSPDTLVVVDASVPWSAVVATVGAAARAGDTHLTFVFAAGIAGNTPPPPPSAVDHELDELAKPSTPSSHVPRLYDPRDPNRPPSVPDKVFARCPIADLFTKIGAADTRADKDKLVSEGLPQAIAACGCKVEIASVQRLMWAWYRRDEGPLQVGIGVDLAGKTGTPVTAKPTAPWAEVGKKVAAAAKAGKPLAFQ